MSEAEGSGGGNSLEASTALLARAIEALEPLTNHRDLVLELKRIAGGTPDAWALDWLGDDGPRRKTFVRKEQALGWLEDRRGVNSELASAVLRPLFVL